MTTYTPGGPRRDSEVVQPSLRQVRDALARVLADEFDAVWPRICTNLHVDPAADDVDEETFDRVLDALERHDPLSRVIATSWRIRRTAARKLAELGR